MIGKSIKIFKNQSVRYMLMNIVSSAINLVTLIIFGRVFSVENYGIISTLQALVGNVTVFLIPLQFMICKTIAEDTKDRTNKINSFFNIMILVNVLELLILLVAGKAIVNYLGFTSVIEYILLVWLILINNLFVVENGIVQGKQDFLLLGRIMIIAYAVKLLISVVLGNIGMGPNAVMIGFALGEAFCIIYVLKQNGKMIKEQLREYCFHIDQGIFKDYLWMIILYIVVSLYINNGDLLLGNLYCNKEEIGIYSVAISLSKISIYLIATPIASFFFPKMVACNHNKKMQNRLLLFSESITLVISVLYGIGLFLFGKYIVTLLYGISYAGAINYLPGCIFFSVILGVFWVFYQYTVAIDLMKPFAVITLIIGIVSIVGILITKCSIGWIPTTMAVSMLFAMGSVIVYKKVKFR